MTRRPLVLAAVLLCAALAPGSAAGKKSKGAGLAPTGRTIAGPALATAPGGVKVLLWRSLDGPLPVCVTVVASSSGKSKAPAFLSLDGASNVQVDAGIPYTACGDLTSLKFNCGEDEHESCSIEWRIDQP